MATPRTFATASRLTVYCAVLLALTLGAMACTISGQQAERTLGSDAPRSQVRSRPLLRRDSASWRCSLGHTFPDEPGNS